MKVIALWDNYKNGTTPATASEEPAVCWLSDSCMLRERKPFYVPEFDDDFRLYPSMALKISRLGKAIAVKFADRYWNEVSLWLNVRAVSRLKTLQSKGLPLAGAVAFDNSLISAPFFPVSPEDCAKLSFTVLKNGVPVSNWNVNNLIDNPQQAISRTSICNTLKTGDVLLLGFPDDEGIKISPGDEIEIRRDSTANDNKKEAEILNRFKIK